MRRRSPLLSILIVWALIFQIGCQPQMPFYLHEDGDLSHYIDTATEIDYPDLEEPSLAEAEEALRPLSLQNSKPEEVWDLPLEEAVRITLENSKVMRSIGGQIQGPPDFIAQNPELVPTIYDPAIVESDPRYGTEAALSAFDAQFSTSVFWTKGDTPRNTYSFSGSSAAFPSVLQQDTGSFQATITKYAATGGQWSIGHNVAYDKQNTSRIFMSDWNVNLEAEMRQPLLQGAGVQFNRIAGPGAIPGYNNGVMIARINTDIALADFESGVRDLVNDVEIAYWELYFAYRNLDTVIAGRDSALETWRRIYALYAVSARGGEAEKEAQAREQYFLFRSSVEQSLNALYAAESKLRYVLGLASTDGRLIRPSDEPTTAEVAFDWYDSLAEALCRSSELRNEKWLVKRRELELITAKNYLLPRLDAVARYRWLGMGDDLANLNNKTASRFDNAYECLTTGDFQEWEFGLELSIPIGFRKEMAGVRNAQLSLARERARLQEAELEVSHQLAYSIRDLEANYVLAQTNFNRRVAAQRQVEAVSAAYETETVTLDLLLDAQRRLAQAESDFFRTVVDYNKSIANVHYRKGSLLEYNGVHLQEGPWPAKAYFDARRRARARDASSFLDYGYTRPKVISRGSYEQHGGVGPMMIESGEQSGLEVVPAPEPMPADGAGTLDEPAPPVPEPQAAVIRESDAGWAQVESTGSGSARQASAADSANAVVPVSYEQPLARKIREKVAATTKAAGKTSSGSSSGWTRSSHTSNRHESESNPSAAATDRSTPGWTGVQR